MNAKVRHFLSPDIDLDDPTATIEDGSSYLLQAIVGPSDGDGGESLQFDVCTVDHLRRRLESERLLWGHSLIVVEPILVGALLKLVTDRIERTSGASWPDVAAKLSKLGTYEYDEHL